MFLWPMLAMLTKLTIKKFVEVYRYVFKFTELFLPIKGSSSIV